MSSYCRPKESCACCLPIHAKPVAHCGGGWRWLRGLELEQRAGFAVHGGKGGAARCWSLHSHAAAAAAAASPAAARASPHS